MKIKNIIPWIARGLSVLITLGLYAFIFELTPPDFEWPNIFLAAIPGTVLLIVTAIAWNFPRPGGLIFVLFGLLYAVLGWYRVSYLAIGIISGGLILAGTGFLFGNGKKKKEEKVEAEEKITKFDEVIPTPETVPTPVIEEATLPPLEEKFLPQPFKTDVQDLEPIIPESTVITPPTQANVFAPMMTTKKTDTVMEDISEVEETPENELSLQPTFETELQDTLPPLVSRQEQIETSVVEKLLEEDFQQPTKTNEQAEEDFTESGSTALSDELVSDLETPSQTEGESSAEEPVAVTTGFTDTELPPLIKRDDAIVTEDLPEVPIFETEETPVKNEELGIEILGEETKNEGITGFDDAQLVSLDDTSGDAIKTQTINNEPVKLPKLDLVTEGIPAFQETETIVMEEKADDAELIVEDSEEKMSVNPVDQGVIQSKAGDDFFSWFKTEESKKIEEKTE